MSPDDNGGDGGGGGSLECRSSVYTTHSILCVCVRRRLPACLPGEEELKKLFSFYLVAVPLYALICYHRQQSSRAERGDTTTTTTLYDIHGANVITATHHPTTRRLNHLCYLLDSKLVEFDAIIGHFLFVFVLSF